MSLSDWRALWQKVRSFTHQPTKRSPNIRIHWGTQTERLEQRALLSAVMDVGQDGAVAAEVSTARARKASSIPNLNGTWDLNGTNGTVLTGTVTFVQSNSDDLTATVNVAGLPTATLEAHRKGNRVDLDVHPTGGEDLHVRGRFNRNHDELSFHVVSRLPTGGRSVTDVTIKFNSNTNPTSFTLTLTSSTGAAATVVGTKQQSM